MPASRYALVMSGFRRAKRQSYPAIGRRESPFPPVLLAALLAALCSLALLALSVLSAMPLLVVIASALPVFALTALLLRSGEALHSMFHRSALSGASDRSRCRVGLVSVCGLLGGLAGVWLEFGPRGLAVLGSWCMTTPLVGIDLLLAKTERLPALPVGMALASSIAMLMLSKARGWRPRLLCCALMLLGLPLAIATADWLALSLLGNVSDWLALAMLLGCASLMALWCSAVTAFVEAAAAGLSGESPVARAR